MISKIIVNFLGKIFKFRKSFTLENIQANEVTRSLRTESLVDATELYLLRSIEFSG